MNFAVFKILIILTQKICALNIKSKTSKAKIFLCCRCGSQRCGGGWRGGEAALRDQPEQSRRSDEARSLVPSSISEALLHVSQSPISEVKIVISFFYFRSFAMI